MRKKNVAMLLLAAMLAVSSWPGRGVAYAAEAGQTAENEQNEGDSSEKVDAKDEESTDDKNSAEQDSAVTEEEKSDENVVELPEETDNTDDANNVDLHSDEEVTVGSLEEIKDRSTVVYHENSGGLTEVYTRTWDIPIKIVIKDYVSPDNSWGKSLGGLDYVDTVQEELTYTFNKPVTIELDNCEGSRFGLVRPVTNYGRWIFNAPVKITVKNSRFDEFVGFQQFGTGNEFFTERPKNWGVEMNDTYTINIENCTIYNDIIEINGKKQDNPGISFVGASKKILYRDAATAATDEFRTGAHKGIEINLTNTDVYTLTVGHYIYTKDDTNPVFFMEGSCRVTLDNSKVTGAFTSSLGIASMKDSLNFDGSLDVKLVNGASIRTFYSEGTTYTSSTAVGKTTGGTTLELSEPASIVGLKGVELLKIAGRVDVTALMELSAKGMKIDITNPEEWNDGDIMLDYQRGGGNYPAVNQANVRSNWTNPNLTLNYKNGNSNQQWYLNKDVTVTFDSDGGTDVASQTVRQGSAVTEPTPAPTKTNSIFEGWYTDKTYATAWTFANPVNQDMTLYAKWRTETANVKVTEKDGKEYGTITVDKGTPITGDKLSTVNVEKKGYTVEKWTTSDGKDWDIENDNVTADMEIHPVWKLNAPQATLGAENNITTVHIGDTVKLTAQATHEAEGNITYQFQWFKDGKEIKANKTKSKATARAVSDTSELVVDESGEYSVKVLASDGAQTAEAGAGPVSVTVTPHQFGGDWKHDAKDHWHECTIENCGVKDQVEAHIFSEWTVVKEATTKEQGERERSCTTCGYKETEKIPMTENEAPVISAKDKDITVGDTFDVKADVKATDKEDGDLTDKIEVVKNTVDTSKAGTYEVTYQVTDTDGATTTLTIKIVVKEKAADVPKDDPKDPDTTKPGNADDKNTTIITKKETKVITEKTPRTGDETRTGVILLGFVAGAAGIVEALRRKKRTNN